MIGQETNDNEDKFQPPIPQKQEFVKLDYNTCNQLRFSFRDNIHKYALVYIVFMSAYFAYGKFILEHFPSNTPSVHSEALHEGAYTQNRTDLLKENKYQLFLSLIGIVFGIALSIACHVGIRIYCRNRFLSVFAIRSQQIMRHNIKSETPLLSGLKVVHYENFHTIIPHGISRGEYQIACLLFCLAAIPIFLSYPFFDIFFLSFKNIIPGVATMYWLLMLAAFSFLCAYTAENTLGHLSEADAITNSVRTPVLAKKWGNEGRDPGYRIFRKEWQHIFVGYFLITVLLIVFYYHDYISTIINLMSYILHPFHNNFSNFAIPGIIFLASASALMSKKIKLVPLYAYFAIFFSFYYLFLMIGISKPFWITIKGFWYACVFILLIKTGILIIYKVHRFFRLSILLHSQAVYNAGIEYGLLTNEEISDINNFTLDHCCPR